MARVVVISDVYKRFNSSLSGGLAFRLADGPAPPELLADTVAAIVLGQLPSADIGLEMAGWLASFLGKGKIVVVAYSVRPDTGQAQLLNRLGGVDVVHAYDRGKQVRGSVPAFDEYFTLYGVSGVEIASGQDEVVTDPLGWLRDESSNPAAARFLIGRGSLYVLPFHAADLATSHDALVGVLLRSVEDHQASASDPNLIPAYLDGMRLPGEQDRLDDVERLMAEHDAARADAERLRSFRAVLGSASGAGLERLVIEALNVILDTTTYEAVDRPDTGAEDFWIVGPEGDFALVEVKGINSSVRRAHVNQVDDHRSRLGRDDGLPAGLLIVNTYRGAEDLGPKQEDLHPDIRAHAVRQNVLVLTGLDLYELLGLALRGSGASQTLLDGLSTGGGWLKVRATGAQLLQS